MNSGIKDVRIRNRQIVLHASGAMYWEEEGLVVISDVHLGKISHFRKFGSAVPEKAILGNFRKLNQVLSLFTPRKLVFLGDLFHSAINQEWNLFEAWVGEALTEVVLVEGNHDVISPHKYEALGVKMCSELIIQDFLFTHQPEEREGYFNFSGHIHPGVRITGKGRQSLGVSCFFRSTHQMILPAFGEFTGKHLLVPQPGDEVYFITGQAVIPYLPRE